jgi:hypothetical protein
MRASPFLIQEDASGETLYPVGEQEGAYQEAWLQELLRRHPDILPAAEIEPVFHPLISIGCEVGTDTGSIDNVFISPRGYLVLVETKLWRNPQARREVVAQAIDYAASLSRWTYSKLDEAAQAYLKAHENVEMDLLGWVEQRHGPVEGGRHFFEETVARNLRLGRFLTVIVGDRIRQSLVDMLNHVNRYPHLATDVALVEMHCYRWLRDQDWPLLVVPSIVARTQVVERSVIQVTVKQDGSHEVEVRQEKAKESTKRGARVSMTEEAFWELLIEGSPAAYEPMRRLVEEYRSQDGISIDPLKMGLFVRLDFLDLDMPPAVFVAQPSGSLMVNPGSLANTSGKLGIDASIAERYGEAMRALLKPSRRQANWHRSIVEVDVRRFQSAVDTFIEEVRRAASER